MTARKRDWRVAATAQALARHLEASTPPGPSLVLADPHTRAADLLSGAGVRTERWCRRMAPDAVVSSWPPEGSWPSVLLRLPRSKEELSMLTHAAASVLEPGGTLLVYGANDEGIRSAPSSLSPVFGEVRTVAVKSRCRVLLARRPDRVSGLRGSLDQWKETWPLEVDGRTRAWVSFPGVFAHGRLDPGSALLLEALADEPLGGRGRILDYGCGSGVIGGVLRARRSGVEVDLLDADAVALEAAAANVPEARTILGTELGAAGQAPYDAIVSNPPYHVGKLETTTVLESLIRSAPDHLAEGGALALVLQARLGVGKLLEQRFTRVRVAATGPTHRVWIAGR